MVGKTLIKFGEWLNSRFPEKIQAEAVYERLTFAEENAIRTSNEVVAMVARLAKMESTVVELSKKVETLTSENTAIKTSLALRTRVASSLPTPGR